MEPTTNLNSRHYAGLIAATGSGSLATSWGRPIHTVFGTTSCRGDGRESDGDGAAQQWPLVMVTNVAEDLASTRARTHADIAAVAASWTSRPARYRDRTWKGWAAEYPSLADVNSIGNWNLNAEREALIDLLRLVATSSDAFAAWVTKSRALLHHATSTRIPADLADLALVAMTADCDTLTSAKRPFLTFYNRARRRTRRTVVANARTNRPQPRLSPDATSSSGFDGVDTMLSVDHICANHDEQRWTQLLDATLLNPDTATLPARTRRTHRATYRTIIRDAI